MYISQGVRTAISSLMIQKQRGISKRTRSEEASTPSDLILSPCAGPPSTPARSSSSSRISPSSRSSSTALMAAREAGSGSEAGSATSIPSSLSRPCLLRRRWRRWWCLRRFEEASAPWSSEDRRCLRLEVGDGNSSLAMARVVLS